MNTFSLDAVFMAFNGVLFACVAYFLKNWKDSIREDFQRIFGQLGELQDSNKTVELTIEKKHGTYLSSFAGKENVHKLSAAIDSVHNRVALLEGIVRERERIYDTLFTDLFKTNKKG